MTPEPYWIVDAFTDRLFAGNPAAVLLPRRELPPPLMQSIAAENNLSETAFAVSEGDAWSLRWFTPTVEVDLCGHATLATAFVLATLGEPGPLRFHTRSGLLTATRAGEAIELDFPASDARPIAQREDVAAAIGMTPIALLKSADLIAVLPDAHAVEALTPDFSRIAALPGGALIVTARGGAEADITSRYFAPSYGINEDPVTGALHTQIVPYWAKQLGRDVLRCRQASRRGGFMHCHVAEGRVKMTGSARLYAKGEIFLAG